jgi:hypothetical protein
MKKLDITHELNVGADQVGAKREGSGNKRAEGVGGVVLWCGFINDWSSMGQQDGVECAHQQDGVECAHQQDGVECAHHVIHYFGMENLLTPWSRVPLEKLTSLRT